MEYPDFQLVGTITKTFGYKGELVVHFINPNFDEEELLSLFIEIDQKLIPFNITEKKYRNESSSIALKFAEVSSEEMAKSLINHKVFVPESIMEIESEMEVFKQRIQDYKVIDSSHGDIGIIKDLIEYPGHEILSIKKDFKEILIPLHEEYILDIDDEQKIIFIEAPEGLIDLYL